MALSFDFNAVAKQSFEQFPSLQQDAVLIDASARYAEPQFHATEKTRGLMDQQALGLEMLVGGSRNGDGSKAVIFSRTGLRAVVYNDDSGITKRMAHLGDAETKTYVVDHELGHILVPDASNQGKDIFGHGRYAENGADAFAAIRNIQRFTGPSGEESPILQGSAFVRAWQFVDQSATDYLTLPALQKIQQDQSWFDFKTLSPAETVLAAKMYADNMMPTNEAAAEAEAIFAPLNFRAKNDIVDGQSEYLQLLAGTALATSSPLAFQIGATAFAPFLKPQGVEMEGRTVVMEQETRSKFIDAFLTRADEMDSPAIKSMYMAVKEADTAPVEVKSKAKPTVLKI